LHGLGNGAMLSGLAAVLLVALIYCA